MIKIKRAENKKDAKKISKIARQIWTEHYTPIIGKAQVEYMLKKFQSENAIFNDIKNGYIYYTANTGDDILGYSAVKKQEDTKSLFLSKLYVKKECRGRGISKKMLNEIYDYAKKHRLSTITLTCNKHNNKSLTVYKKLGFKVEKALVTDIGCGFVMDDYKLTKSLN